MPFARTAEQDGPQYAGHASMLEQSPVDDEPNTPDSRSGTTTVLFDAPPCFTRKLGGVVESRIEPLPVVFLDWRLIEEK